MKKLILIALLFTSFILVGCTQNPQEISYDQDSRKTMIPETCKSFFDGCNNCSRMNDGENIACTKMFCETYEEPKCLDTMHPSWDLDNDGINDCESDGTCDDSVDYTKPKQETKQGNISESCTMEYAPVCAKVEIQCIRAPCEPIEQTFSNRCMINANKLATFLYEGECKTNKNDENIIPETCKSFFDGCNNCFKENNGETICTEIYCETYQEPKCLD
ncbi:MAG: hypothetical protein PHR61_03135 [Candidatus Absconditabacteria bacterium]|nr:hypothetical protein [Candidatus Absconditabacteria bacterium]